LNCDHHTGFSQGDTLVSIEHSPVRDDKGASSNNARTPPETDPGYWHSLIDEKVAAEFLDLTPRTTQAYRQRGGGPKYIVLSSRCIKYRRIDLKAWADARVRTSTADQGAEAV
jgi:hypothetical protein